MATAAETVVRPRRRRSGLSERRLAALMISPVYPQISEAIYNNVYNALWGGASADSALKKANDQIDKALQTF